MSERTSGWGASAALTRERAPRRGGVGDVLLRRLPHDSPMHRLWVGTKLIALALLTAATLVNPGWLQLAGTAGVVVATVLAARTPPSAVPRLPIWFWLALLAGYLLALVGGGGNEYLRLVLLSLLFLALSAVVAWTTALDEVAPTVRLLCAPLRPLRLPIDEWAVTLALCVRSLPLLLDEGRILFAAHRQRPRDRTAAGNTLLDVLTATMTVAIRRATDMGEAITVRGGTQQPGRRANRFGRGDALALLVVAAACVLPIVLGR